MKYEIDRELKNLIRLKMPKMPIIFPIANIFLGFEKCRSDSQVLVREYRLREAGIEVELKEIPGTCHGYETALQSNLFRKCMEERVRWLRKVCRRYGTDEFDFKKSHNRRSGYPDGNEDRSLARGK